MAALDLTSFDAALKSHYTAQRVTNMTYQDQPALAMLTKMEKFGGKNLPIPIIYGNPQGRSATFATAKANKKAGKYTDFVLTRKHDYSLASIDNETIEASMGDANSFLEASTTEIDGAIHSAARSLGISLFRDSSGYIGQVAAEPAENSGTFTVTLADPEEVTNVEVGQVHVMYAAKSGGTIKNSDGTDDEWEVASVNRDTGTITYTATYSSSGTIAANDYIFIEGDRGQKVSGFEGWLPWTAPSPSEDFFGVDRSVDTTRLAGCRIDGTTLPIEEAMNRAAARIAREGGKPDVCFLNYKKWEVLENSLGSKVQYVDVKVNPEVGFRGIAINGPRGPIKVVADQNCPNDFAYMLSMNTWKLYSLGKAPKILDSDGLKMLRESDADAVEVRVGYYAQLGCNAPGHNGVIKLS